jgi:hypothetical protein
MGVLVGSATCGIREQQQFVGIQKQKKAKQIKCPGFLVYRSRFAHACAAFFSSFGDKISGGSDLA